MCSREGLVLGLMDEGDETHVLAAPPGGAEIWYRALIFNASVARDIQQYSIYELHSVQLTALLSLVP